MPQNQSQSIYLPCPQPPKAIPYCIPPPPPPPPKKKIQILYEPLKMYNVKIITDMQREALEISLLAEVL